MKTASIRNPLLALIAVGALLAFILACSSFSPDDSQVLYPTIDPESGVTGVAIYDRETGRSETRFIPFGVDLRTQGGHPMLLRPQWLANGREMVVAWPWVSGSGEADEDGLNLAVLPVAGKGPARLFQFPDLKNGLEGILYPLPIAGSALYWPDNETNEVVRIDLRTGSMRRMPGLKSMLLLPTGRDDRLLYLSHLEDSEQTEIGWMQVPSGQRTPLFRPGKVDTGLDEGFFAVSPDGRRFACLDESGEKPVCRVKERGRADRVLSLGAGTDELTYGHAVFSPDGEVLFIAFLAPASDDGSKPGGLGFLEVPLEGRDVQRTLLVRGSPGADYDTAAYFELGLSGDGRTLAVASTYYACEDTAIAVEDCALFLVDLSDPERKVTKVPVPMMPMREEVTE